MLLMIDYNDIITHFRKKEKRFSEIRDNFCENFTAVMKSDRAPENYV